MANGFFQGGMAEGMQNAAELGLKRDALTAETGLKTRGLDLQERQIGQTGELQRKQLALQEQSQSHAANREVLTRADKQTDDTMGVISETIKGALASNKDPILVQKAIQPLLDSAKSLAAKAGRNPDALDAAVTAQLVQPTGTEAATAKGTGSGTAKVAEGKVLAAGGVEPDFKEIKDKVTAENALRDDYLKQAGTFITIRDGKNRLDSLEKSGAGDMSLVFQFMKMLDPTSTVREGEYASAANSGGVPSAIQGYYNKALGEGVIGDKARADILKQANKFYEKAAIQHDKLTTQFSDIAKRQKLNPDNVTVNLMPAGADDWQTTPGNTKFRIAK